MSPLKGAIWAGIAGPVLFVSIFVIEGRLRAGYDSRSMYISALSLGPRGWIQMLNFVIFGLLLLAFARGIAARAVTSRSPTSGGHRNRQSGRGNFCDGRRRHPSERARDRSSHPLKICAVPDAVELLCVRSPLSSGTAVAIIGKVYHSRRNGCYHRGRYPGRSNNGEFSATIVRPVGRSYPAGSRCALYDLAASLCAEVLVKIGL